MIETILLCIAGFLGVLFVIKLFTLLAFWILEGIRIFRKKQMKIKEILAWILSLILLVGCPLYLGILIIWITLHEPFEEVVRLSLCAIATVALAEVWYTAFSCVMELKKLKKEKESED